MAVALTLFLAYTCVTAAGASAASYEQVGTFAGSLTASSLKDFPEAAQIDHLSGMAININGAGGVPPGTVYTAGWNHHHALIARFSPGGEFREAWMLQNPEEEPTKYAKYGNRCGPDVAPLPPDATYPACPIESSESPGEAIDVEVDQATGNVYVFDLTLRGNFNPTKRIPQNLIRVYTPQGQLISEFGQAAVSATEEFETSIEAGPGKIHASNYGAIAVNDSGEVYVFDFENSGQFLHRLMVFRPQSPGDYEHYVYAGRENDVAAGSFTSGERDLPAHPVVDSAGHIYVFGEAYIKEFDPSQPSAPICTFTYAKGGILAMNVNPETGEVFFASYKTNWKIHQLSACNGQGVFTEVREFPVSPKRGDIDGLAINPTLKWELDRPQSVLYAVAPGPTTSIGLAGGKAGETGLGYIFAPAASHEPRIESQDVSHVTSTSAQLHAGINPRGSETHYVFQYITDAAYQANEPSERFVGAVEVPLGGVSVGSGSDAVPVAASLSGLPPDTEYHFRVVATSLCDPELPERVCSGVGVSKAFRTFPTELPGLPDSRAYELVSPVQKDGGEVFPANPIVASCGSECKPGKGVYRFPMQSAPDGNSVVYEGLPFSNEGAVLENEYIARRTASGWQTTTLSPHLAAKGEHTGFEAFDVELTRGLLYQGDPALSPQAPAGYYNMYRQPTDEPLSVSPLLTEAPPNRSAAGFKMEFAGASADLHSVFFAANDALTGETPFAPPAIDEPALVERESKRNLYESSEGQLRLVNVLPGNAGSVPGATFGSGDQLQPNRVPDFSHAISVDGSRVFWSSPAGQVYVREDGERTVELPDHAGKFLTASADGSKVLLSDGQLLDLEGEPAVDLTGGAGGFQGIAGQSEDLSRVYFVDTAALTPEDQVNANGEHAEATKFNLYAWQRGTPTAFVARLANSDAPEIGDPGAWAAPPGRRTAEASPDGRWLAFASVAPVTGYDNIGPCRFNNGIQFIACNEVFLYDSATGELVCSSCNPSNQSPLGNSSLPRIAIATSEGFLSQPRYLTDAGRLVFDSQDSLSVQDTNNGVEDVYQYEPAGVGTCSEDGGCVDLISAGNGSVDSNFFAMDPSGGNIFFTTRDQLSGRDRDDLIDLYDARENGGIAAETEAPPSECQGESCQPVPVVPNDPTPGSSSFEGAGNVTETTHKKPPAKKKHHRKKHRKDHKKARKSGGSK
jgi:hypothetical protein